MENPVEGTEHLPDPNSDPEPEKIEPPEILESVQVPCVGCGRAYEFDIQPNTATFTFVCQGCGTRTEWQRAE